MPHVREQIRDGFAVRLAGLATTGSRVMKGRVRPLEIGFLPTLFIFTRHEVSKPISVGFPRTLRRTVGVHVEGRVQQAAVAGVDAAEVCDDLLEAIAAEVEAAVASDVGFGHLVKDSVLTSTIKDVEASGDRHEGGIRLSYDVVYLTKENAPGVAV